MTAVGLQQPLAHRYDARQQGASSSTRPQSYQAGQAQMLRQEPSLQNGSSASMAHRPAVNNEPVNGNGHPPTDNSRRQPASTANTNSGSGARRGSLQSRPTSAPNGAAESSQEDSELEVVKRRPKPLLQRAKSDFGPRGEEPDSGEDILDFGARHGFEDHYASEEYVSQLANVGCSFLSFLSPSYNYPQLFSFLCLGIMPFQSLQDALPTSPPP